MAAIQNDRDIILQATSPRVTPVKIPIDRVEGLPQALKRLRINSSATTFIGSTTTNPSTITLTAQKLGGLEGSVTWTVISGTATLTSSGDTATVQGSSVAGSSVSIQARVTVDGVNYEAQTTLSKLGSLASEEQVDLTTQVTGQLASGNVTGLGALALLNKVDLNTQTVGALNGQTQVTNLGTLAYANAIAANQIGAGTLAAGVIYSGTINADKINAGTLASGVVYAGNINAENINAGSFSGKNFSGGTFTGSVFRTGSSGERLMLGNAVGFYTTSNITFYNSSGGYNTVISTRGSLFRPPSASTTGVTASVQVEYDNSHHGLKLAQLSGLTKCPMQFENPTTSFPSPMSGGVFMHSTYGLCISNGSVWLKTTWTPV